MLVHIGFWVETLTKISYFHGITLTYINIRSLYCKLEKLIRILAINDIDILSVGETWLNCVVPDSAISIDDYNILRLDKVAESGKRHSRAVMIYYKDHLM